MIILAIETSCDETAAAVIESREILSNIVFSQEKIHAKFGGVVPEVSARSHIEVIMPVIKKALTQARIKKEQLDAIAVTYGPGLITSLMVGIDTAKALAYALKKPIISVNHLEGHIYANFIRINSKLEIRNSKQIEAKRHPEQSPKGEVEGSHNIYVEDSSTPLCSARNDIYKLRATSYKLFPLLCLIVSGGHTELVYMAKHLKYKLIGETRDDAAGECFDKVAKLLGLGYPGGPIISRLAEKGNSRAYNFPRPMINSRDFDFSFSGLKTDVLRLAHRRHSERPQGTNNPPRIRDFWHPPATLRHAQDDRNPFSPRDLANICASFQAAVCDVLVSKTISAAKKYKPKTIALAGGVAANEFLREKLRKKIKDQIPNTKYLIPNTKFCSDNAAMITACAYFKIKKNKPRTLQLGKRRGEKSTWKKIQVDPNATL